MNNYFSKRDDDAFNNTDRILAELPEYVGYFIVGISQRTSMLTRMNYTIDLRTFFWYLSKYKFSKPIEYISIFDLELLKAFDIEKYLNFLTSYTYNGRKLSCGEKAKERKLSTLRSFFKYLFKKDIISSNVILKVDMPKIHDKPIIKLEVHEVARLLSIVDGGKNLTARQRAYGEKTRFRDAAIFSTFLGTGIRVSELVGLNIDDINFDNNSFSITRKGGNKSILYLPDETVLDLRKYLTWRENEIMRNTEFGAKIAGTNALFLSLQGVRISVRAVELLVKKYSKIAAPLKNITPHKLRSTYATNLYRETGDIFVVADVLGHSDVNTTKKHYAEMSDDSKRRAASVTKLRSDTPGDK